MISIDCCILRLNSVIGGMQEHPSYFFCRYRVAKMKWMIEKELSFYAVKIDRFLNE